MQSFTDNMDLFGPMLNILFEQPFGSHNGHLFTHQLWTTRTVNKCPVNFITDGSVALQCNTTILMFNRFQILK